MKQTKSTSKAFHVPFSLFFFIFIIKRDAKLVTLREGFCDRLASASELATALERNCLPKKGLVLEGC